MDKFNILSLKGILLFLIALIVTKAAISFVYEHTQNLLLTIITLWIIPLMYWLIGLCGVKMKKSLSKYFSYFFLVICMAFFIGIIFFSGNPDWSVWKSDAVFGMTADVIVLCVQLADELKTKHNNKNIYKTD